MCGILFLVARRASQDACVQVGDCGEESQLEALGARRPRPSPGQDWLRLEWPGPVALALDPFRGQSQRTKGEHPERAQQTPFALSALEELVVVIWVLQYPEKNSRLTQCPQPSSLRTLSFGDFCREDSKAPRSRCGLGSRLLLILS
jgi:hypothetical protein